MKVLISFDIDGTLEGGDPPGPVTYDMVRKAQELGCIIGSASDRALSAQQSLWDRAGIKNDFIARKHELEKVIEEFKADFYVHTGDRDLDKAFSLEAGFHFWWMTDAGNEPWIPMATGEDESIPEFTMFPGN